MWIIYWAVFGLVIGIIARFIMPGDAANGADHDDSARRGRLVPGWVAGLAGSRRADRRLAALRLDRFDHRCARVAIGLLVAAKEGVSP